MVELGLGRRDSRNVIISTSIDMTINETCLRFVGS
jgi:hypothetical protein